MKDLIIGCCDNYRWDTIKYWINSVNRCGFEGDKYIILMNCDKETLKRVHDSGFNTLSMGYDIDRNLVHKSMLPVHVERFFFLYDYLRRFDYRYVVTTDVKDVVFQRNPIEYLEKNDIQSLVFSSESIQYKNEPWGDQNLFETFGSYFYNYFRENEIYNVGVLAGKGYAMRDLSAMIFNMSINRQIPIVDQSTFNFMVSQEPYKSTALYTMSESGWACQLGTTMDPNKIENFRPYLLEKTPKIVGDLVTTSEGVPYYIVHQYDRIPTLRQNIEKIYGD
jgi:hypothetical protein